MVVVIACGLLVAVGLTAGVRWGGLKFQPPPPSSDAEARVDVARRYVWYLAVAAVSGLGAGVLVAGAGGRLVMRLLAVTSPGAARGRVTEANEIVGEITVGGTVGFVVFTGLFFGLGTGVLYLLVRRWLPAGRLGGLAFGGLLLVVAGTRIEPLRPDNADFDIVGPSSVALLAFGALVVLHGVVVAALAARYATTLPLLARERRALVGHAPLLLLLPAVFPLLLLALVGLVAVALSQVEPIRTGLHGPKATFFGRVILAGVALVALPGFVTAVVDIAGSGP
ncbi:MAG TPA: hypothetical protein VM938_03180 [Acidimicrobiales bacterium]|nr:hypothetical protein [Acidimicrobiales bacterium]